MKTKVAKLVEIGRIEIVEEEVPPLKPQEILVQMKAVGVCGSDLHYFLEGGLGSFKENLPIDMGHEPAGIVIDAGINEWLKADDRVAIEPGRPCLHCHYCLQGLHNLCQKGTFMGAAGNPGAFREYVSLSEHQLIKIADSMSFEEAALLEPMGIAYHSLRLHEFKIDSTVAIFGVGPIGLSVLAMVKMAGASKVFVVDKLQYRLDIAESRGADFALLESPDVIPFIQEHTKGLGVDVAYDAAGVQETVDKCFLAAAPGGKVVLIGIPTYDYLQYNPHKARIKELTVHNVRRSNQTIQKCHDIFLYNDFSDLVTHRFSLDDIQDAFEMASEYRDGVVKAIITF